MDVFNTFSLSLPVQGTREQSTLILVNVLVKEWPWNMYFDLSIHSTVHVRDMHVQQVSCIILFTTVLAFVNE